MKVIKLLDMLATVLTELDALAEQDPQMSIDVSNGDIWTHGASFTRSHQGEWTFVFTDEGSMYKSHGYSDDRVEELVRSHAEMAVDVRDWHILQWSPSEPDSPMEGTKAGNPQFLVESRAWNHRPGLVEFAWIDPAEALEGDPLVPPPPPWFHAAGWDRERVLDVFMAARERWQAENGEAS